MWKIKAAIGLLTLLALAGLYGWGKHGWHLYRGEQAKVARLVGVTAEVAQLPKLKVRDAPAAIRSIGRDRDTFYSNWQLARGAVVDQTNRFLAMKKDRDAAIATADRARDQMRQLVAQRDSALRRFRAASTRTERKSAEAELAECEGAMDALYKAGM